MRYPFGPDLPTEFEQLERGRRARELLEQLMPNGNALPANVGLLPANAARPWLRALPDTTGGSWSGAPLAHPLPYRPLTPPIDPSDAVQLFDNSSSTRDTSGIGTASAFPFRQENRKPDGTWDAPDATRDNIKGTSVDHFEPVWPRWRQTPPPDGEGEFISHEPFFDIDEIAQKAEFYPPVRPLVDTNIDGNPLSRQRINDLDAGNSWRRRLIVDRGAFAAAAPQSQPGPSTQVGGASAAQTSGSPLAIGELTDFGVIARNPAGGASNLQAYDHWREGSGTPLDIDFSDANVSSLSKAIADSAAGLTQRNTFQSAINESLMNSGAPAFVNTTAAIDTGGAVIGRVDTELRGWVTTRGGKWEFEGYVVGKTEPFDFNSDPDRGPLKNTMARALDALGGVIGAADYQANYTGSIAIRASGNVRR